MIGIGDFRGSSEMEPPLSTVMTVDLLLLGACGIGWPIAVALRFPAPVLLGPLLISAAIHIGGLTASQPPQEAILIAQIVLGASVGARFVGATWGYLARTVRSSLALTTILLALTFSMAWVFHLITGLEFEPLVLAFAPGGLAEMSLVALSLGEDPAFVAVHQILRILIILFFASQIYRWFLAPQKTDD